MRRTRRFLPVLAMLAVPAPASASIQERSAWFGEASFGPVMQDRNGNDLLRQSGLVIQARAGRRIGSSLSALVALTHTSVTRKYDVAVPMLLLPGSAGFLVPRATRSPVVRIRSWAR